MKTKVLLSLAAALVCCACVIGGTVAWLKSQAAVKNTFAVGDVAISLTETTGNSYKLIPGTTLKKDPKVVVHNQSVSCWVFVKVDKKGGLDDYVSYTIADGWEELESGIYYRSYVEGSSANATYSILKDDEVRISEDLSKSALSALKGSGKFPVLSFTAYAVQMSGIPSVNEAWEKVKNL